MRSSRTRRPEAKEPQGRRGALGRRGEDAVAGWYADAGYVIVERNWRCREGELDLIAARGSTLVFCEVKTRSGVAFGSPQEAVTWTKQRRLRRLAAAWLQTRGDQTGGPGRGSVEVRFDVASVRPARGTMIVEVIESAF